MIVQEANAIGTALLRTSLIEQPERGALKALLERYLDVRVEFYDAGGDETRTRAALAASERLHAELWRLVVVTSAARREPTPITALFVSEVVLVIDMHGLRLAALTNHVPSIVMWMLLLVAVLSASITGYASGFSNKHDRLPAAVVQLLIASLSLTIVDLERPRRGLIRSRQSALLDLQHNLKRNAAASEP